MKTFQIVGELDVSAFIDAENKDDAYEQFTTLIHTIIEPAGLYIGLDNEGSPFDVEVYEEDE